MSLTSDTYEYIREINILETKAISGEIDKLFTSLYPFKLITKWEPFKKFMRKTRFFPFAKRTFENGIRREVYDVMQSIDILNKKNGGTEDSKKAYSLVRQKWDLLPKRQPKKSDRVGILGVVIASLTLIVMISSGGLNWMLPIISFGAILLLPTIVSLGVVSIFNRVFERWWYNYCKYKIGVDHLKSIILDKTLENSD